MRKAVLYKKTDKQSVQCLACSWYCKIAPKKVGICATRLNKQGILYSLVYGKAIGLYLDPVEKKPLYHFLPSTQILSFGTVGCNFACRFCQNWDMSQVNKNQIASVKYQKWEKELKNLIDRISITINPQQIVNMALKKGAVGIAYTYNEPAIFAEFTHDTAVLAKKKKLKNIYVSNGFESKETFDYIKNYIDAINIDLKSISPIFYRNICKAKIEPVLSNIKKFFNQGIETEVTTLIIPGKNDSSLELTKIAKFLSSVSKDIPWHISAFYPAYQMADTPPTSAEKLFQTYEIGKKEGLKFVYVGNIVDDKRSATYCPKCKQTLISRHGYYVQVKNLDLKKGRCAKCFEKIYGIWKY